MKLKVLHLNVEEAKRLETIVEYVRVEDFAILQLQEVTGNRHNFQGMDSFTVLKERFGYSGVQGVSWRLAGDPSTYFSNATFYKPTLTPVKTNVVYLKPYAETTEETLHSYADHPHCALDVSFSFAGQTIHFINTHLAWGPTPEDEPYKIDQGKILYEYVKSLNEPFVLSGDFNVTPDSQIVQWMNTLGRNHVVEHAITNTLNPNTHRIKHLFPEGLAVDFLFTDPSLQVTDFKLIDSPDLSDHFGLAVTLEV